MSWDGMLPATLNCIQCDKPLNENGQRPAELYAGTFTGICYECERKGEYCTHVDVIDRAEHWDFPPCCPSYNRSRQQYVGYDDCPDCNGKGAVWQSRPDAYGGSYRAYCKTCFTRYNNHPARRHKYDRLHRIRQATFGAIVGSLIQNNLASRRKQRGRDGRKFKDHKQVWLWLYISTEEFNKHMEAFKQRAAKLTERMEARPLR